MHTPLAAACPLTKPNTYANGRISYGTTGTKGKWAANQTSASDSRDRPQRQPDRQVRGLLHLFYCHYFGMLASSPSTLGLFTQHRKSSSSWSLRLTAASRSSAWEPGRILGESHNEEVDRTLCKPPSPSRLWSASRAQGSLRANVRTSRLSVQEGLMSGSRGRSRRNSEVSAQARGSTSSLVSLFGPLSPLPGLGPRALSRALLLAEIHVCLIQKHLHSWPASYSCDRTPVINIFWGFCLVCGYSFF